MGLNGNSEHKSGTLENAATGGALEIKVLRQQRDRYKAALEDVRAHGCCVMHSDRGCPGCIAKEALGG